MSRSKSQDSSDTGRIVSEPGWGANHGSNAGPDLNSDGLAAIDALDAP